MLIQPVQPVPVQIKIEQNKYDCHMISLSHTELELSCPDYLDKNSQVLFIAQYFRGKAFIKEIRFSEHCFNYTLEIEEIQFQPGLLINTRL